MSYKNSAGVKLNDATELVIVAAPDGTVESCYNNSNNTEYAGDGSLKKATVTITNNHTSSVTCNYTMVESHGYAYSEQKSVSSGGNVSGDIMVNSIVQVPSGRSITGSSDHWIQFDTRRVILKDEIGSPLTIS